MQNIQLFSHHSKAFTKPLAGFSVFPTALLGKATVEKHPSALLRWSVEVETELKGRCNTEVKLRTGFPGGPLSPGFPGRPYRSRKRKKTVKLLYNNPLVAPALCWLIWTSTHFTFCYWEHCSLHVTNSKLLQISATLTSSQTLAKFIWVTQRLELL